MEDSYPDDENGQVLRGMASRGVDLGKTRSVDFSVVFESESEAQSFCTHPDIRIFECKLSLDGDDAIWDVTVTVEMIPTHEAISKFEEQIASIAEICGGEADGWGFLVEKVTH